MNHTNYMKQKKIKKLAVLIAVISVLSVSTGCSEKADSNNSSVTNSSASQAENSKAENKSIIQSTDNYDENNSTKIEFSDEKININGKGAESEKCVLTINKAGTYIISGKCKNGRIIVDADKNSEVKIVLDGVDLTCSDNAPVYVSKAKNVTMVLNENTKNKFTDGKEYSLGKDDSNTDGCIFSKADFIINGKGTIDVTANYKHGIVSKDNLGIAGGTINVTSASSAVIGKDSVEITDGTIKINAGTNGIKSTNTEDKTKGFVEISGGTLNIVSQKDAVEAETNIIIEGGNFNITTNGGSENASMKSDGKPNENWGRGMDRGNPPDRQFGGNAAENAGVLQSTENSETESVGSAKALKAGNNIKISGGEFKIDSSDDSLHCNGNIDITGGKINATSGDDGIHADKNLTVSEGTITISKSYEGMEGAVVTISGGTFDVTASDDGINCAGGSDTGSADRPGADQFAAQEGVSLNIKGGNITVDAGGDGLDSNGDFNLSGGKVIVNGPSNGGNGALDYNGEAKVTGGTLVACGTSDMAEGFGESSTQYSFCHTLSSSVNANEKLKITDSEGKEIFEFTPTKQWQNVVFTSSGLKKGQTYTISAGSVSEQVTLDSVATSNASGGGFGRGEMKRPMN